MTLVSALDMPAPRIDLGPDAYLVTPSSVDLKTLLEGFPGGPAAVPRDAEAVVVTVTQAAREVWGSFAGITA